MDTKYCENCHSDISTGSWTMHQLSCARYSWWCEKCDTIFPRQEQEKHNREYHEKLMCGCGQDIEARLLVTHQHEDCPRREVECKYCEYPMFFSELAEHEIVCGSRTEPCEDCGARVQLAQQESHVCGTPTAPTPTAPTPTAPVVTPIDTNEFVCAFCLVPTPDWEALQEHIFSEHSEQL